jgi:hypothetical protein
VLHEFVHPLVIWDRLPRVGMTTDTVARGEQTRPINFVILAVLRFHER